MGRRRVYPIGSTRTTRRREAVKAGRCANCADPALEGQTLCARHRTLHRTVMKRYQSRHPQKPSSGEGPLTARIVTALQKANGVLRRAALAELIGTRSSRLTKPLAQLVANGTISIAQDQQQTMTYIFLEEPHAAQ